jgi:hypothetical protein
MRGRLPVFAATGGIAFAGALVGACAFELGDVISTSGAPDARAPEAAAPPPPPPAGDGGRDAAIDAGPPCPDGGYDTNARHCGRCGHDCITGACEAGVCQPGVIAAATGRNELEAIAARKDVLYVGARQAVLSCATAGCGDAGPNELATTTGSVQGVAADDTYVYFVDEQQQRVARCPLAGCGSTATPTEVAPTQDRPVGVVVDAVSIYFTDRRGLYACPLGGCGAALPTRYADESESQGLILFGGALYFSATGGTNVGMCPTTGCAGARANRIYDDDDSWAVGADGSEIFFNRRRCTATDPTSNACTNWRTSIERCPLAGCGGANPTQIIDDTGDIGPFGLAVDGTGVYYASGGRVRRVPKAGGVAPVTLFQGGDPRGVTLDARGIYWTDRAVPRIMGLAKP